MDEFVAMAAEYLHEGDDRYKSAINDYESFLKQLADMAHGRDIPPGEVITNTFWLVGDKNTLLGCSRLRYELTKEVEHHGHIGYDIRPTQRGKGYGTRLLGLTLEKAKEKGMDGVLVTCRTGNTGSSRIIEKNGGVLQNRTINTHTGMPVNIYWIDLKSAPQK